MAASFTIAARNNGFAKADARASTLASVHGLPRGDGRVRGDAHDGHLVRPPGRGPADGGGPRQWPPAGKQTAKANTKKHGQAGQEGGGSGQSRTAQKAHTRDSLQALSKLGELVDGQYRIVSQPPIVVPARELTATSGPVAPRRSERLIREQFRAYRATLQRRPAAPAGAFPVCRHGPQGGGRGQRRHPGVHRPAAGTRRRGPAVPAGQGGDRVGAGGPPAEEPLPAARRAGGAGAADDAGRQRHLSWAGRGART